MAANDEQQLKIQNKLKTIWDDMGNNPSKALTDSEDVEKKSIDISYPKGIRDAKLYQGWCLIYLSKLREAIEVLSDLSGNYNKDNESEEYITVLNALGVAYNDLGDFNNAFYHYSLSLKLSRKANFKNREMTILNNMGTFFLEKKNYDKALNHFMQILATADKSDLTVELESAVLINIGICYSKLERYEEAEKALIESRVLSEKQNNSINDVESLYELAAIKYGQKDIISAKKYISTGLEQCKLFENKRFECEFLIMLGDIEESLELYEKAIEISRKINYKPLFGTCCFKLSEYFEKHKNYELSLKYIKEHHQAEKELTNLAAEKKFHNLEMEYEIERNRKNAELFKIQNIELKESLNWMTILNKIARETISSLELNNIFNTVYSNINILMDAEIFHIAFYDRENDKLNVIKVIENGIDIEPFTHSADENSSFAAWSIKNKKEVVINNLEKEYKNYIKKRSPYGSGPNHATSMLTVPIFMRNDEMGILAILSYYENAYKEQHVQLLKSLAAYLAIAIDNSRNFEKVNELNKIILEEKEELEAANEKILELATHDNLTGLANRRVFNEMLKSAMEQSNRRGETLAVLFIDVDNFKPVNDTWGHDAGDKVLIEISNRLKSILRASDSVARIGGDEFLILLNPVKNRDEARKVAQKVIQNVSHPIKIKESEVKIGMSIGISMYPEQEATADQLIIHADSAMYKIKKGEKNGIGFYKKD
ncbi:MAG: diguanylate cyclase [Spirochaetaceae bacterium]|jgi:diguanylate cyclase (GGDEF)-like protein|nr:diguanylate cyclase [Spirochaetaceae bacterium]